MIDANCFDIDTITRQTEAIRMRGTHHTKSRDEMVSPYRCFIQSHFALYMKDILAVETLVLKACELR